jgi:hypothetical protein
VAALTNLNIKKLTSTYITLSLEDIKTSTGLANIKVTEKLLLKMVSQGEIKARINQQTGTSRISRSFMSCSYAYFQGIITSLWLGPCVIVGHIESRFCNLLPCCNFT